MKKLIALTAAVAIVLSALGPIGAVGVVTAAGNADITSCQTISSPGLYTVGNVQSSTTDTCLHVQSDDVVLEGDGSTVSGPGDDGVGVKVRDGSTELTNVTVRDVNFSAWSTGMIVHRLSGGSVSNVTVHETGAVVRYSSDLSLQDGTFIGAGRSTGEFNGISGQENTNVTIESSTFRDYWRAGIDLDQADGHRIASNTFRNVTSGVDVANSTVTANTFLEGSGGVDAQGNTTVTDNVFRNAFSGVSMSTDNNTVLNNTAVNVTHGIRIFATNGTVLRNNTVKNSTTGYEIQNYGDFVREDGRIFRPEDPTTFNLANNAALGNDVDVDSPTSIVMDNLTVSSGSISLRANSVTLRGVESPPEDPPDNDSIGVYLNASDLTDVAWANLTVGYGDDVNESQLEMYHYHDGSWESAPSKVDTERQVVTGNVTSFSVIAPMEQQPGASTDTPTPTPSSTETPSSSGSGDSSGLDDHWRSDEQQEESGGGTAAGPSTSSGEETATSEPWETDAPTATSSPTEAKTATPTVTSSSTPSGTRTPTPTQAPGLGPIVALLAVLAVSLGRRHR